MLLQANLFRAPRRRPSKTAWVLLASCVPHGALLPDPVAVAFLWHATIHLKQPCCSPAGALGTPPAATAAASALCPGTRVQQPASRAAPEQALQSSCEPLPTMMLPHPPSDAGKPTCQQCTWRGAFSCAVLAWSSWSSISKRVQVGVWVGEE